jgi:hypothetical protein
MSDSRPGLITVTMADIARQVVAELQPAQLPLLDDIERRNAHSARRDGSWSGGAVGIGVDPVVLSEVIFPVLTGAMAQITGTAAGSWWQRQRQRRRRKSAALTPTTVLTISTAQLEQIKIECVRNARALGLPPAKAQALGDAVLGVLSRRSSEPAPPDG